MWNTLVLLPFFIAVVVSTGDLPEVTVLTGTVGRLHDGFINSTTQTVFYYDLSTIFSKFNTDDANVRVSVSVQPFAGDCPVLFSVRERRAVLSWELPIVEQDQTGSFVSYYSTERTLCSEVGKGDSNQAIQIEISTCSVDPINFLVSLTVTNDIVIRIDDPPRKVEVSPVAPVYYRYDPPETGDDSVLVSIDDVSGDEDICVIFSIQQPQCPVLDQEQSVQFRGYWQSMTTKASILLRRDTHPNGFFIVLVALTNGERCSEMSSITDSAYTRFNGLEKNEMLVTIERVIEPEDYVTPVLVPLAVIFGLILLIFIVFSIFQNMLQRISDASRANVSFISDFRAVSRFQSCLCLEELKEHSADTLQRKSNRYFLSVVTIGIFYCVPVIQLISNYLRVLYRTGDYDLCYYNYRCARPLGYIMDFNHIYSNTGYVICGIAFIVFVSLRQRSLEAVDFHPTPLDVNVIAGDGDATFDNTGVLRKILPRIYGNIANEYGTLQNYGIYYALGVAIILEGVLSSAYHICPNQSNFQFDTSFMYVIAVLGIVKVYQFRHPMYLSANITFISLAFVAASSVFGLLFDNLIFKICFSVFYFVGLVILLIYMYHVGFTVDGNGVLVTSWVEICKGILRIRTIYERRPSNSSTFGRILFPVVALLINITIIVCLWTVMVNNNFATQLLAIFVTNFSAYVMYYATMKLVHREYKSMLWIQLLIYGILSLGLWILSLYYFQQAQSSWEKSPAQSRELNDDCILFSFYDNHDLWHFTSSAALLTSFMLLLTMDDDLITTKHENIPVF